MSTPTITLISPSKPTLISHDPPEESLVVLKLGNKSTPNDDDIELDVFGAEKYFNSEPVVTPKNHQLINVPTRHHLRRPKKDELALEIFAIKPPPPQLPSQQSTRSESSCNSRSSLLQPVTTRSSIHQQQQKKPSNSYKKTNKKLGFLARIGCKCSCVTADDDENKTDVDGGGTHIAKRPTTKSSLQVLGVPEKKKLAVMMTWDAVISPEEDEEETIKTVPSICGGDESDASSDLFEIESLSRGRSPPCYAPSEASVEWSVVTASAADLEEPRAGSGRKEMPRLRRTGGMLLSGCTSQKAVGVVGGGGQRNLRTESFRFHGGEEGIKLNSQQQRSGNLVHA